MFKPRHILATLLFAAFLSQGTNAANPYVQASTQDPQFGSRRNDQKDPIEERMIKQRLKAIDKERYESLKKDTAKLLQLATELKESVDKSSKDMLSLEVIKKTEEVEKLAKSVREKMKNY